MTILNSAGKPVVSKRQITLEVVITDKKPGDAMAERASLMFALDDNSEAAVTALMQNIAQTVVRRLRTTGFIANQPGSEPGRDSSEIGKGSD